MGPEFNPRDEEHEALKRDSDPRNDEPECTCTRVDVDLYDARGCELCDPQSGWNRECAARDRDERPAPAVIPEQVFPLILTDDDAPF